MGGHPQQPAQRSLRLLSRSAPLHCWQGESLPTRTVGDPLELLLDDQRHGKILPFYHIW